MRSTAYSSPPRPPWLMKSFSALAALMVAFSSFSFAQTKPADSSLPVERLKDAYAIYSLLLPGDVLANVDSSQNQRWAIAEITVNAQDINPALAPEAALQAPATHATAFHEAVADYNLRKNERSALKRHFHVDRPYSLLDSSEVAEFRAARTSATANSALRQKYNGYPGITYFSDIYFNPKRTAALVYMLDWCGNLCAQAEWVYLEKHDGQWVRRSGRTSS